MLEAFKKLFTSMKFWTAVISSGVVGGLHYAGASDKMVEMITAIAATLLGAQGLGEFGTRGPTSSEKATQVK